MFISKSVRNLLIGLCAAVLSVGSAYAQSGTVTGKVSDKNGEPLIGVYVFEKGTQNGVSTNLDGLYEIKVADKATLTFSLMGYKDAVEAVNGRRQINVILEDDALLLEGTVVTALGIKKERKALGYAVEDIKSDELMLNKTANPLSSLSGKIAGVNITQSSGAAGSGAQIVLRGATSASEGKDSQPLFVVDGIIYDNSSSVVGNSAFDGTSRSSTTTANRLMDINPEDIESMSVLKGPAASALYGSRAANGVIIITTKRGKEGAVEVNFNSKLSTSKVSCLPEVQTQYTRGYMEDKWDAAGNYTGTSFNDFAYTSWGEKSSAQTYDNLGNFFRTGVILDESVSVAGGTKNSNYYFSGSYYDQDGVVPGTGYTKYTFRLNAEQKIGIFTVGANAAYSQAHTDKTLTSAGLYGSSGTGALAAAYTWSPFDDMTHYLDGADRYRMFGDRLDPWDEKDNPYWIVNKNKLWDDTDRFTGGLSVKADIAKWWNIVYRVGIDQYTQTNSKRIAPNGAIKQVWQKGMMSDNVRQFQYISNSIVSNMNWTLGDFGLGLLVGATTDDTTVDSNYKMAWNFSVPEFYSYANADTQYKQFSESQSEKRLAGVYGEISASWKNTLFLTVTGRNDWTSTLPVENRSYFYPSVSLSAVFTQPLIDKGIIDDSILSFGKIRASFARVGKDTGAYETNTSLWPVGTYLGGLTGVGNSWTRGNPYLKPEITQSTELGLELSFLKNRIHVDYAYYTNDSYNQIISPRGPQSTGYIFCSINAGNVYNKGQELSISATPIQKKDFSWDVALNMAGNRSNVDGLATTWMYMTDVQYAGMKAGFLNENSFMAIAGTEWTRAAVAKSDALTYVKDANGNLQEITDDNLLILDANGMPTCDNTYKLVGDREVKLSGGINNTIRWKNFMFNMLWEFRFGGDVVNGTQYAMDVAGTSKFSGDIRNKDLTVTGVVKTGTQACSYIDEEGNTVNYDAPVYETVTNTWSPDKTYVFSGKEMSGYNIIKNYYAGYYLNESANYITTVNLLRLRSISLSYQLPQSVIKRIGVIKGATVSASANNLLLFTNYAGDPEVAAAGAGVGGSSSVGFDYCGVPATSGMTFGVNLTF